MDTTTFAKKIKEKYPEYTNLDDTTLVQKIIEKYPTYKTQITDYSEVPKQPQQNVFERISAMTQEKGQKIQEAIAGEGEYAGKSDVSRGVSAAGQAFSAISNTAYQAMPDTVRAGLDKVAGGIGKGFSYLVDKISNNPKLQEVAMSGNTKKFEEALQIASDLGLISGEILGVAGTAATVQKSFNAAKTATMKPASVPTLDIPKTKDAFLRFVSPDVDDTVKTAFKDVPTEKFDDFVKTAEEASMDATKPSVYEKVANQMESALKQQNDQIGALSQQKNTIIQKAKTGLTDFSKETGQTILDLNRALPDNSLAKSFIARLKTVKTKIDADKIIDELQNELYKGNKALTIPVGSTEDMILRKALGKYNSSLKSSLPPSYAKLNDEISKRLAIRDTLNTALGEVVDGVPVRGASLIKQFFSPAGTKTKQIFQSIKETTGIDLAQDAILARYVGDAFGDVKVRSLLEGVPSTTTGALEKIVDFTLEKVGAKKALTEAKKKGVLERGRSLTVRKSNPKTVAPKKITTEIKDFVSKELNAYDDKVLTVNGRPDLVNPDTQFRLSQLKEILNTRALTNKEVAEAYELLGLTQK